MNNTSSEGMMKLPVNIEDIEHSGAIQGFSICDSDGQYVVEEIDRYEYAEHIVKCVNAHDGLVESLSNCMSLLWSLSLGSRPKPEDVSAAIKKADKAIEAAGMGGSDANI